MPALNSLRRYAGQRRSLPVLLARYHANVLASQEEVTLEEIDQVAHTTHE